MIAAVAEGGADYAVESPAQLGQLLKKLEDQMFTHAQNLEFEQAARLRDQIAELKERRFQ